MTTEHHFPDIKIYMHQATLDGLPQWSVWPALSGKEALQFLKEKGFEGLQGGDPELCKAAGIGCAADGRINTVDEVMELARRQSDAGYDCSTVHLGWGIEDNETAYRLIEAVLKASDINHFPIYIETHRATLFQDIWRTVQFIKKFPEIRLNGDFSHYYTGQELSNGDINQKLDFMQPIFERVRFMHGRIGSPGSIQVDIGDGAVNVPQLYGQVDFVEDFREMWRRAMSGFLKTRADGEVLIFTPELLNGDYYYARKFSGARGQMEEESDRFAQALLYKDIAKACYQEAMGLVGKTAAV